MHRSYIINIDSIAITFLVTLYVTCRDRNILWINHTNTKIEQGTERWFRNYKRVIHLSQLRVSYEIQLDVCVCLNGVSLISTWKTSNNADILEPKGSMGHLNELTSSDKINIHDASDTSDLVKRTDRHV